MNTVYSKPDCSACLMVKKFLATHSVPHTVIDITQDAQALALVNSLGYKSAPVVVEEDGSHWSQFRYDRLVALKEKASNAVLE